MYNKSVSKIVRIVCLLCCVLLTFGAILFFLPIGKSTVASAFEIDTVDTDGSFQGGDILIPVSGAYYTTSDYRDDLLSSVFNTHTRTCFLNVLFTAKPVDTPAGRSYEFDPFSIQFLFSQLSQSSSPMFAENSFSALKNWALINGISFPNTSSTAWQQYNTTVNTLTPSTTTSPYKYYLLQFDGYWQSARPYSYYVVAAFYQDTDFIFSSLQSYRIGYQSDSALSLFTGYHYIRYTDVLNHNFELRFYFKNDLMSSKFILDDRHYYMVSPDDSYYNGMQAGITTGREQGYNEGYTSGYANGEEAGNSAGYNTGYAAGTTAGDSAGYSRGYSAGVNAANTYSFTGLISAVIDAPIKAFTGMLNFDVFGYNMKNFYLSLITLSVIIFIIKMLI